MLVLTRKISESFEMNKGEIKIKVLNIVGDFVRIGIDAPLEVDIVRSELNERKHKLPTISYDKEKRQVSYNKIYRPSRKTDKVK